VSAFIHFIRWWKRKKLVNKVFSWRAVRRKGKGNIFVLTASNQLSENKLSVRRESPKRNIRKVEMRSDTYVKRNLAQQNLLDCRCSRYLIWAFLFATACEDEALKSNVFGGFLYAWLVSEYICPAPILRLFTSRKSLTWLLFVSNQLESHW
jgi:hypothetical protein